MTDLILADVSEYQGQIDWHAYVAGGYPAAIVRVHNGFRADSFWPANRDNAHAAGVQALGLYQYVIAGADVVAQANAFCDLVGALKPGEWPICDLEEGSGDQSGRAQAWYSTVAARLNDAAGEELYSDVSFYDAHQLAHASGFKRTWLAAYGTSEPGESHDLWQFTDSRSFPGIGTTDASIFHGSIDALVALAYGGDMPLSDADKAWFTGAINGALQSPANRGLAVADDLWWWQHAISGSVPTGASPAAAAAILAIHAEVVKLEAEPAPVAPAPPAKA